jgi:glycosyltransferase involved in cell wall biosynthesis
MEPVGETIERVSVGILGYNEEFGVAQLLDSLHTQTLFQKAQLKQVKQLEVIVISNGSQDQMAAVAREKLKSLAVLGTVTQVIELPIADKCAAWNHFIHKAAQAADCYIFLDADVTLIGTDSLSQLVTALRQRPECRIYGGQVLNPRGEIVNRDWIDGKCYAIRGTLARNIYIPNGIVLDDAYVASTVLTNWYEISPEVGRKLGYLGLTTNSIVQSGHTPRDRNKSYWIACRKRTIMAEYTQYHLDYCMRVVFGGGELARDVALKLSAMNPNWFTEYLHRVSKATVPKFAPPQIKAQLPDLKEIAQIAVYCYCYMLSTIGIRNREFGHLAWKLKGRYW